MSIFSRWGVSTAFTSVQLDSTRAFAVSGHDVSLRSLEAWVISRRNPAIWAGNCLLSALFGKSDDPNVKDSTDTTRSI
jgi:hypothetical protein